MVTSEQNAYLAIIIPLSNLQNAFKFDVKAKPNLIINPIYGCLKF